MIEPTKNRVIIREIFGDWREGNIIICKDKKTISFFLLNWNEQGYDKRLKIINNENINKYMDINLKIFTYNIEEVDTIDKIINH